MRIALCYDSVLPSRGGAEMYIAQLARRLAADAHDVHLYACQWDDSALPATIQYHRLSWPRGPRFYRPWRFAAACAEALRAAGPHVSIGFNKTWGQDVQYPQGGLHLASVAHNRRKYSRPLWRRLASVAKRLDPAYWSFRLLERRQYLGHRPLIVAISNMVREHCRHYYHVSNDDLRVIHSAIDPDRFAQADRPRRRLEFRDQWGIKPEDSTALFVALNYRLKGLEPLLHAVARLRHRERFRLLVVGNPRTQSWERLASRLGIGDSVCFVGPRADVHHCYFAADFLVHPTFYDPCSLVVLEALACGLPVITSRYNGAAELLTPPRDGFVVDNPHDHEQLADYIELLRDPARRAACSQAARRTANQWTFDTHYRKLLAVLEEAAARKRAA
jgi:UDP-glucose:(heptosyl)LPS alpha-1,3-glucosyltransferase